MAGLGALIASLPRMFDTRQYFEFPMAATTVYQGGAAVIDTATGYVTKAQAGTTYKTIGRFAETKTNAGDAGSVSVNVRLAKEVLVEWFANGTDADAIAATDILKPCYWLDDQTVSIVSTGHSMAGLIYGVSASKGVAVLLLPVNDQALAAPTITSFANAGHTHQDAAGGGVLAAPGITSFANAGHTHQNAAGGGVLAAPGITAFTNAAHTHKNAAGGGGVGLVTGATLEFAANALTIATPGTGVHYKVPATAGASVITIGTTNATRGDFIVFTADGSDNGHTVTYNVGATAITAAATASKRHVCIAYYDGTTWAASLSVGP